MWSTHSSFWDDYVDPLKITIDGVNKLIYINLQYSTLDIKEDLYSAYKRWIQRDQNAKYPLAIRTVGGDPTTGDQFAGDIYFLINGWKVILDPAKISIVGVLYSDDYDTAYWLDKDTKMYPTVVSSLVTSIKPDISTLDLTGLSVNFQTDVPTVDEISDAVWNKMIADLIVAGSTGERLKKLLTLQKFVGLK